MTDKETVLALRIHNDKLSDCSKCPLSNYNNCYELLLQNAIYWIEHLATNRTQGEWKEFIMPMPLSDHHYKMGVICSECNTTWDCSTNYCPFCGADMKGDSNG